MSDIELSETLIPTLERADFPISGECDFYIQIRIDGNYGYVLSPIGHWRVKGENLTIKAVMLAFINGVQR